MSTTPAAAVASDSEWAWIALGSNVGHRGAALECLRRHLAGGGLTIEAASAEILTRPVGVTAQGDFHNQLLLLHSSRRETATGWLGRCQAAEVVCGRRRTYRWGPRRADADIVLLGRLGEVTSAGEPIVPHPELANRPFWLRLIGEIDPSVTEAIGRWGSEPRRERGDGGGGS